MTVWPATLPQKFLAEGFEQSEDWHVDRSPRDLGPALARRRWTRPLRRWRGTMRMSDAQYDTFREFFDADLGGGVVPFSFPAPVVGGYVRVRFLSDPEYARRGPWWMVTIELEEVPA